MPHAHCVDIIQPDIDWYMKILLRIAFLFVCFIGIPIGLKAQSTVLGTLISNGITREYRIYVPASYSSAHAVPLLLNLHGYTSNGAFQEYYGDFRAIADTANFLIVHPNGTFDAAGERFWNTWVPPGNGVDDVKFLSDLLTLVQSRYSVDPERIYSTGMSNGGFMSYELACQLSSRIAAIASVTGSILPSRLNVCTPLHPVPILEIHGTADYVVPYNSTWYTSIPSVLDYWVRFNGCSPIPVITNVPNTDTTDACTAVRYQYGGGRAGSVVEHYRIVGGGHSWPGAPTNNNAVTNRDINASKEIWRFLRRYRLNQLNTLLSTSSSGALGKVDVKTYPNPVEDVLTIASGKMLQANQLLVTDVFGKKIPIHTLPTADGNLQVLTSGWDSGVYVLRTSFNGTTQYQKIVKI